MEVKFVGVVRSRSDVAVAVQGGANAGAAGIGTGAPAPSTLPVVTANAIRLSADAATIISLPPYSAGQLVLAACAWANGPAVPATPAGWTLVTSNAGATGPGVVVWSRVMDGSEGSTLTHASVVDDAVAVAVAVARAASPVVAAGVTASFPAASNPPVVAPTVAATAVGQLLLNIYAVEDGPAAGPPTITPPTGQAALQIGTNAVVANSRVTVRTAWERIGATGATGTRSATTTAATAAASVTGVSVLVGEATS